MRREQYVEYSYAEALKIAVTALKRIKFGNLKEYANCVGAEYETLSRIRNGKYLSEAPKLIDRILQHEGYDVVEIKKKTFFIIMDFRQHFYGLQHHSQESVFSIADT